MKAKWGPVRESLVGGCQHQALVKHQTERKWAFFSQRTELWARMHNVAKKPRAGFFSLRVPDKIQDVQWHLNFREIMNLFFRINMSHAVFEKCTKVYWLCIWNPNLTRHPVFLCGDSNNPWRRKWQPTPLFLPRESQGQGSLAGCRLWGRTESDTTEAT